MLSHISTMMYLLTLVLALCAMVQSTPLAPELTPATSESDSLRLQRRRGNDLGEPCTGDEGCLTKTCFGNVCYRFNPHMGFTGISDDGYTLYGLGMQYPLKAVWDGYDEWKGGERRLMFENGTMLEEGQYWRVQY